MQVLLTEEGESSMKCLSVTYMDQCLEVGLEMLVVQDSQPYPAELGASGGLFRDIGGGTPGPCTEHLTC